MEKNFLKFYQTSLFSTTCIVDKYARADFREKICRFFRVFFLNFLDKKMWENARNYKKYFLRNRLCLTIPFYIEVRLHCSLTPPRKKPLLKKHIQTLFKSFFFVQYTNTSYKSYIKYNKIDFETFSFLFLLPKSYVSQYNSL